MSSPAWNSLVPALPDAASAERLRHLLASAGYDEAHLYPLLVDPGIPNPDTPSYRHVFHRTATPSALNTLVRLFVLGRPMPQEEVERSLPFGSLDLLRGAKLVTESEGKIHGGVSILPYDGLLIAFDSPHQHHEGMVMSVSGSSLAVARSAVRQPRKKVLDVGTGNGYLALMAARWSEQVVATDVSRRALDFAIFNSRLNGVENVEFRAGDRFAPVEGDCFDQILCNPPFAVTPGNRFLYRDGGAPLDGFCRELACTAPRYLEEGGIFQMVCDWVVREDEDAENAFQAWFQGSGCEVFAWRDDSRDPVSYAEAWVSETEGLGGADLEATLEQWVAFYQQERIREIDTAYVLMRRRRMPPPDWFHLDAMPLRKSGEFGTQLWRQVTAREFLRAFPSNDSLLQAAVRPAPELVLKQECDWNGGGWRVVSTHLQLSTGLGFDAEIDQRVMGLIARCDGAHPLVDIVLEMAKALRTSSDSLIEPTMRVVRKLVEEGFLVPEIVRRNAVN